MYGFICRNYCTQRRRRTVLTSDFAHFAPRIHAQAVVARQGEDLAKSSKYRAANRDRAKPLGPAHAPVRTHLSFSEKRRTKSARHQAARLILPNIGNAQRWPLWVCQLIPRLAAGTVQPLIELGQTAPAPLSDLAYHASPAVLHVLLDDALLPPRRPVTELVIKQVMPRHRLKPRIDTALLALANLVYRRLHVVVDAPLGHTAKHGKAPGMGIKQHLMGLREVGQQQERPAGGQFDMRHLLQRRANRYTGVELPP